MDDVKTLAKELFDDQKNAASVMQAEEIRKADEYSEGYKDFLRRCNTP